MRFFGVMRYGFLLLSVLLLGCSGQHKPDWLSDAESNYPQKQFLSAVGDADTLSTADQRAMAGIARIFEVSLQESSLDFTKSGIQSNTVQGQSKQSVDNEQVYERSVQTQVNQVLEGVKVVQHWQSQNGHHYSLAVLDKAQAGMRFRRVLSDLDGQISQSMQYAKNKAKSPITKLSALQKALNAQLKRDSIARNLGVVSASASRSAYKTSMIESTIRATLSNIKVNVKSPNRALTEQLQQAVHGLGAQLSNEADYVLEGYLDVTDIRKKQGWYWQQGALDLIFKKKTKALAHHRQPIKLSATEVDLLQTRLNDELSRKLTASVYQLFVSE